MAATVTAEVTLGELNASFEELRKADKELRERLFVLQVARKFDWDAANKMARRKAGDYDDPELAKVLEEREKKEDKIKRDREKERAKSFNSPNAKRGRFQGSSTSSSFARNGYQGYSSPLASNYAHDHRQKGSYGRPQGSGYGQPRRDEQTCNNCHQKGHFWKTCPNKK